MATTTTLDALSAKRSKYRAEWQDRCCELTALWDYREAGVYIPLDSIEYARLRISRAAERVDAADAEWRSQWIALGRPL